MVNLNQKNLSYIITNTIAQSQFYTETKTKYGRFVQRTFCNTMIQRTFCVTESTSVRFHVTRNERYVLTNSSLLVHGLRNNLKWLQPLLNMFVFDPTYAYFLVIVVPNHEIMIQQKTYVSCDETEMSLQEGASNTLNAVFINKECYCIKY